MTLEPVSQIFTEELFKTNHLILPLRLRQRAMYPLAYALGNTLYLALAFL